VSEVDDKVGAALTRVVPPSVTTVCRELSGAGHEAWAVGGAIRDALLGRDIGDWDVATSARPEQVQALFRHTIPTGIEHGTVTVMIGAGRARLAIEVTTFRGEGAYSDARRPDEVTFGVPLDEDLARRDFTINAVAFDPLTGALRDPFGGRADLARRLVRAVGDPETRFREDGLRVMRALRFVAQLDFKLHPATEAALEPTLDSLRKVARERIRTELFRLLAGPAAPRALEIAQRRGVLDAAASGLARPFCGGGGEAWKLALARLPHVAPEAPLRLAALLVRPAALEPPMWTSMSPAARAEALADRQAAGDAESLMRELRASNADRARVAQLATFASASGAVELDEGLLRRIAGRVGRERARDLVALWRADAQVAEASGEGRRRRASDRMEGILTRRDPISARDLALKGGELIEALGLSPGPAVGALIHELVEAVCDDPSLNHRDALVDLARAGARRLTGGG
jgi:tRNA nucleotidyltransferase (CCA-adding enzyme)